MDVATIVAVGGLAVTGGTSLVMITVYATQTRSEARAAAEEAKDAANKARNVQTALTGHIAHADNVYVRKETIAPQLATITEQLSRIEDRFDQMMGGPRV